MFVRSSMGAVAGVHQAGRARLVRLAQMVAITIVVGAIACGGGGGDGGGSEDNGILGNRDPNKRTSGAGVRVIHAALDVAPVDVKVGETFIGRTRYLDVTYFNSVPRGPQVILVERANSPGVVVASFTVEIQDKTEYTVLLTGQEGARTLAATLLEEPVTRPASGQGRLQVINLLENSSPLTLVSGAITTMPAPYRLASGFVEVPAGPYSFSVLDSQGRPRSVGSGTVPDRGELSVVLGGALSRGVTITKLYSDLD